MKKFLATFSLLLTIAALSSLAIGQSSKAADSDAVAAITKLENDMVKADLTGDPSFYQNNLADDWTGGTSRGTWDTKQSVIADMKDTKNNKTNSESISELKVRVHGDAAIANARVSAQNSWSFPNGVERRMAWMVAHDKFLPSPYSTTGGKREGAKTLRGAGFR